MDMDHSTQAQADIIGTDADDTLEGSTGEDRINGRKGNDVIHGNGGADMLNGNAGDDYITSYNSSGLTGLYGQDGNDTLAASVESYGQVHMGGGSGDDRIIMDLTNDEGWQGHHAYGGTGADVFEFVNVDATSSPIMGRIDDFNASEDEIWIDGEKIDLYDPPAGVRVVSYLGQQWLSIEDKALYALEGAREGGDERHFSGLPEGGISSLPTVDYVDPVNFIPVYLYPSDMTSLNEITSDGTDTTIDGTSGADWYHDYVVNGYDANGNLVESADALIRMGAGNDFIESGKGDDRARGGAGNDVIAGGSGNDKLYGDAGDDTLFGGTEDDFLEGGLGNDELHGGFGDDKLAGNEGHDLMFGEDGEDRLSGHAGNDTMYGGNGNDRLFGNDGNDLIYGGDGEDYLSGAAGDDRLFAGGGRDRMNGHGGDDFMSGGTGNDNIMGGAGDDTILGGDGIDVITGGGDMDVVTGGAGRDVFVFHGGHMAVWGQVEGADFVEKYKAIDTITDFEIGVDRIRFTSSTEVDSLEDMSAWKVDIDGDIHFALRIDETNERILVNVEDDTTWREFMDDGNFFFY